MRGAKTINRMQRNHGRAKKQAPFNIVSLMDIFTILVFFLLVNASDPSVLPNAKGIEMPQSVAEQKPRVTVVLMLNQEDISLQGKKIVNANDISSNRKSDVQKLQVALQDEMLKMGGDTGGDAKREITIMGDKQVPFSLIKRVMQICSSAGFDQISLSVIQKESTVS